MSARLEQLFEPHRRNDAPGCIVGVAHWGELVPVGRPAALQCRLTEVNFPISTVDDLLRWAAYLRASSGPVSLEVVTRKKAVPALRKSSHCCAV